MDNNSTAEVGDILQEAHYYPYGLGFSGMATVSNGVPSRYTFNGKEAQEAFGMQWIDFGARMYDAQVGRWMAVDGMAEAMEDWSPYCAMINNPVKYIDPNGRFPVDHIEVEKNPDGTYTVKGGIADNDKRIYIVDDKGIRTGEVVGEMLTKYSFHDNNGQAIVGARIDINDLTGANFFKKEILQEAPSAVEYMWNATGGEKLDFKTRGIEERPEAMSRTQYSYRGMQFNGKISSARDVGNYEAGYIAGKAGFQWWTARKAFDLLESYQQGEFAREGQPTQRAQYLGHENGYDSYLKNRFEKQWKQAISPWPPIGPKF